MNVRKFEYLNTSYFLEFLHYYQKLYVIWQSKKKNYKNEIKTNFLKNY